MRYYAPEDEGEKDRGTRVSVSNYDGTEIRIDLAAMKAREERAQARPQLHIHATVIGIDHGGAV